MARPKKYSPEVRERAVRLVFESLGDHPSEWAAITSVAGKIGCIPETLRQWVRQAQRDSGTRAGLTTTERDQLKKLEREVRELKRANEILRLASAYFAHRDARLSAESVAPLSPRVRTPHFERAVLQRARRYHRPGRRAARPGAGRRVLP